MSTDKLTEYTARAERCAEQIELDCKYAEQGIIPLSDLLANMKRTAGELKRVFSNDGADRVREAAFKHVDVKA